MSKKIWNPLEFIYVSFYVNMDATNVDISLYYDSGLLFYKLKQSLKIMLRKFYSSKLHLYSKVTKNACDEAKHLKSDNFSVRQLFSKFRLGDHSLGIDIV